MTMQTLPEANQIPDMLDKRQLNDMMQKFNDKFGNANATRGRVSQDLGRINFTINYDRIQTPSQRKFTDK